MATIKTQEPQQVPAYIEKQLLSVEMIPVADLTVDHAYQRYEDPSRIAKMAREWDWNGCGHLAVSLRKGVGSNKNSSYYAVIDGQQRLQAIRMLGYNEAPCRVYVDLNKEQEAQLYELLNSGKKPSYNDLFKSRLARDEDQAKAIQTAVEQIGYHLDFDRKRASGNSSNSTVHFFIQSMVELDRMYAHGGVIHIMDTMKLYKECFAGESVSKPAMILAGISMFLRIYPEANRKELVDKMRRMGHLKLVQNAVSWTALQGAHAGTGRAFSESMLICNNANRQEGNRLKSRL